MDISYMAKIPLFI